jgi:hypothetical protein
MSNIYTGRILANNSYVKTIEIRPHFKDQTENSIPNPEYKINGLIADAKRIKGYSGITNGFKKAVNKQNCQCVIIDFNKHFVAKKILNINKIAGNLMWRKTDFETGRVKECYLIYRDKSIRIIKEHLNDRDSLSDYLKGLMPQ